MNAREIWIAFTTIWVREVRRFLRIWQQTLVPPAITMILYFVIFGNLIGRRIGEMGGTDYMNFIVPGLIMMSVITSTYANVASSFFSNKFQRSIEEMLVAPVPNIVILSGFVLGGVTRGLLVGAIVTVLATYFADLELHNISVVISVVFLSAVLFALAGFINAIYANKFDDISLVPTFVLTPLTYLGGVFYSISLLPEFWQKLSMLNPILYMVNAFRYGILGVSDIHLTVAYAMLLVMIAVLLTLCLWLLYKGTGLRQ